MTPAPAWLEDFQARFGDVVRTPLDRATGTLTATPERYDARTVEDALAGTSGGASERLAIYNRQYWFRLFEVLQSAFPLTRRLTGAWSFNGYASRYLAVEPPRGWDIDAAAHGFETWFVHALDAEGRDERDALAEAAHLDAAYTSVFRAPPVTPFHPSADDAARLLDAHLLASPAVAVVDETRPLLDLRRRILGEASDARVPIPPVTGRRAFAIARTDHGTLEIPLETREAELLSLLKAHSVRDALAQLEHACSPEERTELPSKTRGWLARAVRSGFWVGLRADDGPSARLQPQTTQL